jgi:hypothetical protein
MTITEVSQAQRYVERTFRYRIFGTGAHLKTNLLAGWQPNDDFTGRTLCIYATLFIYDKISVKVLHIPAFSKTVHY